MPKYQRIGNLIPVIVMSMFWSCIVVLQMLFRMVLRGGPKKYFAVNERERTSVLDSPDLGTHGFLTLKDLKIHYVAKGNEDKPLMLFLHGFPEFWYSWRHQLKEFGQDYRAVAIDMRGYGESDKPTGVAEYHMSKLTGDVKEVIHALGYEKAIIVSHDWGGAVAWIFATQYPEMVEKVVFCNIGHPRAMEKHLQSSLKQVLASWYIMFFQMPWLPELSFQSEDLHLLDTCFTASPAGAKPGTFKLLDIEAWKYTFAQPGAISPPLNYYRAVMRYRPPKIDSGNKLVQAPALIVWGTGDTALGKPLAEMSLKYCQDGSVRYIEGASHWVQQEEPHKVNEFIREFLATKESTLL